MEENKQNQIPKTPANRPVPVRPAQAPNPQAARIPQPVRPSPNANTAANMQNTQARQAVRPKYTPEQQQAMMMQHTAKIQGGAVIRPLTPPSRNQPSAQNPRQAANPAAMQARPANQPAARPNAPTSARPASPVSPKPQTMQSPRALTPTNQTKPAPVPKKNVPVQQKPAALQQKSSVVQQKTALTGNKPTVQNHLANPPQNPEITFHRQNVKPIQPDVRSWAASTEAKRTDHDDFEIDDATYTKKSRVKHESVLKDSAASAVMSLVKAVVYIIVIIAVSVGLSVFVVNTANDVFKFVVDDKIVTVEIPEYATVEDVGIALRDAGAIKYPWAFNLWTNIKERNRQTPLVFVPGTYELSTTLNYDYLRAAVKERVVTSYEEIRLTIHEGDTVDEIIDLFVENGIGTREGFIDAIENYDFNYEFLKNLNPSDDRIYRLEGYLFPDTYYFYVTSTEVQVLNKMLDNFNRKFAAEYYVRCQELGLTVDEVITLASMIEKEARFADDLGDVSSVFHNRIKYKTTYPYLNSDATIMYAIHHDTGSRLDTMTGEDTEYDTPYNTYTHRGLPPGPIANPGLNSIKYALYPNSTDYFYFVSNSIGRMLYATTDTEHAQNVIIARSN